MSIKLLLLKSGEDVIAYIQEMVVGEKVVGYIFNKPCKINMKVREEDTDKEKTDSVKIRLTPWIILTKDIKIPVSLDWVITLVDPIDQLAKMYEEDILNNEQANQIISTNEQSDSDNGD